MMNGCIITVEDNILHAPRWSSALMEAHSRNFFSHEIADLISALLPSTLFNAEEKDGKEGKW
jgi:hypothetical protein